MATGPNSATRYLVINGLRVMCTLGGLPEPLVTQLLLESLCSPDFECRNFAFARKPIDSSLLQAQILC